MIDERKIVARELAGAADPDHEAREGFFPYREMADRIVTALEKARKEARIAAPKREMIAPDELRDLRECKRMLQLACGGYLTPEQMNKLSTQVLEERNSIEIQEGK